jgi:hypothetical protein
MLLHKKVETTYWVGTDNDNCITFSCMELGLFIRIVVLETPVAFDIASLVIKHLYVNFEGLKLFTSKVILILSPLHSIIFPFHQFFFKPNFPLGLLISLYLVACIQILNPTL